VRERDRQREKVTTPSSHELLTPNSESHRVPTHIYTRPTNTYLHIYCTPANTHTHTHRWHTST